MIEKTISSQLIFEGRVLSLRVDTVELPNGRTAKREVIEHRGSVAIVPIDENQDVLMVRQYRKAADAVLLEVPAGTLDRGEDPDTCARRELREETGYSAGKMERMGGFYSAPGFSTEYLHLYLATELTPSPLEADDDENIELVRVPLGRVEAAIATDEIRDAKSVAGLLLALARLTDLASRP